MTIEVETTHDGGPIERLEWERWARERYRDGGRGTLAIDFDDTLTHGDGVEALVLLRAAGWGLAIHTANADIAGIRAWLRERWPADDDIPLVTDRKPQAHAYVDDKAVRFEGWDSVLREYGA